jgi:hypothetical protein
MNQPASLRSDRVAGIPWNGWPACSGLSGRNRLDYVADFTGMRICRTLSKMMVPIGYNYVCPAPLQPTKKPRPSSCRVVGASVSPFL